MSTNCSEETFDGIRIEWRCDPRGAACEVKIWWLDSLIVAVAPNKTTPVIPFSATTEDQQQQILGELNFRAGGPLLLDLTYPGGEVTNYQLWPCTEPPPPPPRPKRRSLPPKRSTP